MPRKRKLVEPDVIHQLGDIVELRILEVIQDGAPKHPGKILRSNVYLVECRQRLHTNPDTGTGSRPRTVVLKTFPPTAFHEGLFQRELAAYTELQRLMAVDNREDAWMVLSSYDAEPGLWPFCFGQLEIPDIEEPLQIDERWLRPSKSSPLPYGIKQRRGLLLEYIPNIIALSADKLTDKLIGKIRHIINELHARNVVHGDFVDNALWPHIGFANIFLRRRADSEAEEVLVMDFNRSRIVDANARNQAMAEEEAERMTSLLGRALTKKMVIDEIPKEVRKLLG